MMYTISLRAYKCCLPFSRSPSTSLAVPDCLTFSLFLLIKSRSVNACTIIGDALYMHSCMLYMCEWCIAFHSFPTCIQDGIWPCLLIYPSSDFVHAYNTQIYHVYVLYAVICKVYHRYTSVYHSGMPCVRLWLHLCLVFPSYLHKLFRCWGAMRVGWHISPFPFDTSCICVDCPTIHAVYPLSVFLSTPYAQGAFLSIPCTQGIFLSSHTCTGCLSIPSHLHWLSFYPVTLALAVFLSSHTCTGCLSIQSRCTDCLSIHTQTHWLSFYPVVMHE